MKRTDRLNEFNKIVTDLKAERAQLQERIDKIDTALNVSANGSNGHHPPVTRQRRTGQKNSTSLAETVRQVLGRRSLTKKEILDGVLSGGYVFQTKNPKNSLGALLYAKNSGFTNHGGKFSVR